MAGFEEFDEVFLEDIMFADEEADHDETPNRDVAAVVGETSNGASGGNQQSTGTATGAARTQRKKRIPRPKSTYTLAKASEEQVLLLQETATEVAQYDIVTENSPDVKTYAEECVRHIRAGAEQVLQFITILNVIWPAVAKADTFSTGPARAEAANAAFFQLRITPNVRQVVVDFFEKLTPNVTVPYFFVQVFSRMIFERLFLRHEHIAENVEQSTGITASAKQQNALRYVAGYVVFKMPRKIQGLKEERDQMGEVIKKMQEGADKQTRLSHTQEWVEAQSRGGLCMVNDETFLFLQKLEEIIQQKFPTDTPTLKTEDLRMQSAKAALENRTILEKWTLLTAHTGISEPASLKLLQKIVDFYIQIRLFSFTRNIVERCKIKTKTTRKQSKGLRGAMKAAASSTGQSSTGQS